MSVEGNAARFGAEKNLMPSPIWAPMRVRACLPQSRECVGIFPCAKEGSSANTKTNIMEWDPLKTNFNRVPFL